MNAQQFKQARKDLNLTQRQLAKELGLSEKNGDVYIRKVENNRANPSGLLIKALEMYYKLTLLKESGDD
jgi:transcriptional regulator with XRE-family HTH domain